MRLLFIAFTAFLFSFAPANAESQIKVGRLSCNVEGGIGLIIGSSKAMTCTLHKEGGGTESYSGRITKVGLDIGFTKDTHIEWLVFTAGNNNYSRHALAGTYVGASGEASIVIGGGANWLIGGSRDSFMLQPWSIQGQTGLNFAVGLAGLTLN